MGHGKGGMLPVAVGENILCCDTHCSVALKPQLLQAFDLQLWQKNRLCEQSGDEQQ